MEGTQVDGSQYPQGFVFPRPELVDSLGGGSGSGGFSVDESALDLLPPASITLPPELLVMEGGGVGSQPPLTVANLLVVNVEQFFPSSK